MVKEYFMYGVLGMLVLAGAGYFLWLVGESLLHLFRDWRLNKELGQIEATAPQRKQQKEEESRRRLENGCEHVFDDAFGAFPPGVCRKCGIAQQRPHGSCDHIWRRVEGAFPGSRCEKCGKTYRAGSASPK